MSFKLRPFKPEDANGMLEWMHDPDVNYVFSTPFAQYSKEQVLNFIALSNEDTSQNLHLACVNDQDEYLGTVSLKNINYVNQNAEYAISFRKAAHGTGASAYATKEILRIAFEELKLEKVYLYLFDVNQRADSFYKKCGFVYEATFVKHMALHGELRDIKWYRMLRDEWLCATHTD